MQFHFALHSVQEYNAVSHNSISSCVLGFKLDCQLHQVIVARFADEQLIIDFDNFVRCLIRLETLFSEYLQQFLLKPP